MLAQALTRRRAWRLASQAVAVSSSVGAGFAAASWLQRAPVRCASASAAFAAAAASAPVTPITPALNPADGIRSVVLYQYQTCPFCNKVRAYLDHARVPYVVVEVDPVLKGQLSFSKYRKVPIAVVNGVQINDSSAIIDAIDAVLRHQRAPTTSTAAAPAPATASAATAQRPAGDGSAGEATWREWVNGPLVQVLTANIYRSLGEAWNTFDYLTERNFATWSVLPAKVLGAAAMTAVAARRKKQHGWSDERAALIAVVNDFADAVAAGGGPFLGGAAPNLADVEAFGAMRAIAGLDTWSHMLDARAGSRLGEWYKRMEAAVGPSQLEHRVGEAPGAVAKFAA